MPDLFEQVASLIEQEFYDDIFLQQQWPRIKTAYADNYAVAADTAEREAAINNLLQALDVSHAMLIIPRLAAIIARQESHPERLRLVLRRYGSTLLAQVRSFKARTTRIADPRQLADALDTTRNLVLDLRLNDGGSGAVATELASIFLPPDTPILRFLDRIGRRLAVPRVISTIPESENLDHEAEISAIRHYHYVEYRTKRDPLTRYDGNVTILLASQCSSAGEGFVQCMKEWSQATIVGQPSRGYLLAAQDYDLSDGYALLLPFAEARGGKDAMIEGIGVSPHIPLDVEGVDDRVILDKLTELGLMSA